jgi:hypothetical protein
MKVACALHSDAIIIFVFHYIENLQSEFSNGTQRRAPHETFYTVHTVSSVHFRNSPFGFKQSEMLNPAGTALT